MTIEKRILTKVEVTTLEVFAGVRYWEDATVNDKEDEDGDLIPLRDGDVWKPVINIDTGIIQGWPSGTHADIHYKVCDAGTYRLLDAQGKEVGKIEQDYVPSIMCPGGDGYGDYIIMTVDHTGKIQGWDNEDDLDDFFGNGDD